MDSKEVAAKLNLLGIECDKLARKADNGSARQAAYSAAASLYDAAVYVASLEPPSGKQR